MNDEYYQSSQRQWKARGLCPCLHSRGTLLSAECQEISLAAVSEALSSFTVACEFNIGGQYVYHPPLNIQTLCFRAEHDCTVSVELTGVRTRYCLNRHSRPQTPALKSSSQASEERRTAAPPHRPRHTKSRTNPNPRRFT